MTSKEDKKEPQRESRGKKVKITDEEAKPKAEPIAQEAKKPAAAAPTEERVYTVPLSKTRYVPYYKRATKAIRLLRSFFTRHMKAERVIFTKELNESIWANGIRNPPRKVKVRATKDDEGNVTLYLAEK